MLRTYNRGHLHVPVHEVLSLVGDCGSDDLASSLLIPVLIPGRDDMIGGSLINRVQLVQLRLDDVVPVIFVDNLSAVFSEENNFVSLEDPARNPSGAVVLLGQGKVTGERECRLRPGNRHRAAAGERGQESGDDDSGIHDELRSLGLSRLDEKSEQSPEERD